MAPEKLVKYLLQSRSLSKQTTSDFTQSNYAFWQEKQLNYIVSDYLF